MKKGIILIALILMMTMVMAGCGDSGEEKAEKKEVSKEERYNEAKEKAKEGKYAEAVSILRDLGDYENAEKLKNKYAYKGIKKYLAENGDTITVPINDQAFELNDGITKDSTDDEGEDFTVYAGVDNKGMLMLGSYEDTGEEGSAYTVTMTMPLKAGRKTTKIGVNGYMEVLTGYTIENADAKANIAKYKPGKKIGFGKAKSTVQDINGNLKNETKKFSDSALISKYVKNSIKTFFDEIGSELNKSGIQLNDLGFKKIPLEKSDLKEDSKTDEEGSEESSDSGDAGAADNSEDKVSIDIEEGKIVYKGWEYAPNGFVVDGAKPEEVMILNFEYTNKEDEGKEAQDDFYICAYQNGVELSSSGIGFNDSKHKGVANFYKSVMKGKPVTISTFFKLEDKSPVTVEVQDVQSHDKKEQFEIKLK